MFSLRRVATTPFFPPLLSYSAVHMWSANRESFKICVIRRPGEPKINDKSSYEELVLLTPCMELHKQNTHAPHTPPLNLYTVQVSIFKLDLFLRFWGDTFVLRYLWASLWPICCTLKERHFIVITALYPGVNG